MLGQYEETSGEVSETGKPDDQCCYIYCAVEAKLTGTAIRLVKDNGKLREELKALDVHFDSELGRIRCNNYENLIRARLSILKLILDRRHASNESPEVVSNGESLSHVVSQPTEQQDFTNAMANELYYMYERKGCSGYWSKRIESQYKVTFNYPKFPSIHDFCKTINHQSSTASREFFSTLTLLRQMVSIVEFPLPAAFTRNSKSNPKDLESLIENELNKWPENSQSASAHAQPCLKAAVFANFSPGQLICVCKNEQVERVEFTVRRLIRETVIQIAEKRFRSSRALVFNIPANLTASASSNAIQCTFKLLSVDTTLLPADVHVNVLEGDLKCVGGLGLVFRNAAGREMQEELSEISAKRGFVPVGEAVCTRSYALPSDFVLHAIGPDGRDLRFIATNDFKRALLQTYLSVLKLAADLYPKDTQISMALPLLSAGNYRGSHSLDECAEALAEALSNAFSTSLLARFKVLFLVNLTPEVTKAIETLFNTLQVPLLASVDVPHVDGTKFADIRSEDRNFEFSLVENTQKSVLVYSTKSAAELYRDSYHVNHPQPLVKEAPDAYQNQASNSSSFGWLQKGIAKFLNWS